MSLAYICLLMTCYLKCLFLFQFHILWLLLWCASVSNNFLTCTYEGVEENCNTEIAQWQESISLKALQPAMQIINCKLGMYYCLSTHCLYPVLILPVSFQSSCGEYSSFLDVLDLIPFHCCCFYQRENFLVSSVHVVIFHVFWPIPLTFSGYMYLENLY